MTEQTTVPAIVSFTTTSNRIARIAPMIESVLAGEVLPKRFVMVLCRDGYEHMDDGNTTVPPAIQELVDTTILEIMWLDENHGSFTKLHPILLEQFDNPEQVIVTADDDIKYPKYWLKRLYDASVKNPRHVIAYRSRPIIFDGKYPMRYASLAHVKSERIFNGDEPPIVMGKDGVLYRPRFFSEYIFSPDRERLAKFADDLWISQNLSMNHIPVHVLADARSDFKTVPMPHSKSLWESVNMHGNNDRVLRRNAHFYRKPNSFLITGFGRSGTKFLSQLMNRSEEWYVAHEERGHNKRRFDKDNFGEVNSYMRYKIDNIICGMKGFIIRDPADIWISVSNRHPKSQWDFDISDITRAYKLFLSYQMRHRMILFDRMTTDAEYLQNVLYDFGITDVDVTDEVMKPVNSTLPKNRKHVSMDDFSSDIVDRIEIARGYYRELVSKGNG